MYICMYVCVCVYLCVCMYVCVCVQKWDRDWSVVILFLWACFLFTAVYICFRANEFWPEK